MNSPPNPIGCGCSAWPDVSSPTRGGESRRTELTERIRHDRTGHPSAPGTDTGDEPAAERLDEVRAAMARLSDDDEELLRLLAWERLSHAEAAAVLGCP
ncbi:MAG: sigma factor-like helix-turn-helix DNA-binding protein [Ilumatobacteraceae bacterium]